MTSLRINGEECLEVKVRIPDSNEEAVLFRHPMLEGYEPRRYLESDAAAQYIDTGIDVPVDGAVFETEVMGNAKLFMRTYAKVKKYFFFGYGTGGNDSWILLLSGKS